MRVQSRHAVEVAVLLSEIEPVTNHELRFDIPTHVFDLNVGLDDLRLTQQGADSTDSAPRDLRFCCSTQESARNQ